MRPLIFVLALFLALPAFSAPPPAAHNASEQADTTQTALIEKVQAQVETLDREVEILKEVSDSRLDSQDQRIGDLGTLADEQGNYMSAISNVTSWVGIGITLLALLVGFVNFFTVKNQASTKATEVAEQWFQQHAEKLLKRIASLEDEAQLLQTNLDELRKSADQAHESINRSATEIDDRAKETRKLFEQAEQQIFAFISKGQENRQIDPSAVKAVAEANLALDSKPESEFTSEDFFARGLKDYLAEDYSSALLSFDRAIESTLAIPSSSEQLARFMFGRGVSLASLHRLDEAIEVFDNISKHYGADADPTLRTMAAQALINKGFALEQLDRSTDALTAYDMIVKLYSASSDISLRKLTAQALTNKGITLARLEQSAEGILAFDMIIERYSTDPDPVLRLLVAQAMTNKGTALQQPELSEEAIAIYDAVEQQYGTAPDSDLRSVVATALFKKGLIFGRLGRNAEAFEINDAIDQRYGTDPDPALRVQVAQALINKGVALERLERNTEALAVYDMIDQRYGSFQDLDLRAQVAQALIYKCVVLERLECHAEAILACDIVDQRYSTDPALVLRELVAKALTNKGMTFQQLERNSEAITVSDIVDQRYGSDPSPTMRTQVATALNSRAFTRIMLAKQHWRIATERNDQLSRAIDDLRRAQSQCANADLAMILGNLGYALFLIGTNDEAALHTRECLRLGRETLLNGQHEDAQKYRVEPQDTNYERLLEQLWTDISNETTKST